VIHHKGGANPLAAHLPEANMTAMTDSRLELLREVYNAVAQGVESFECNDRVGADLAYLLGAILNDTCCEWPQDRAIVKILREHFPDSHPVHGFIEIARERPRLTTARRLTT
jgi:hypothetical protein